MTYWTPKRIRYFRIRCTRECFEEVVIEAGPEPVAKRHQLDAVHCPTCGDKRVIEALHEYTDGAIPGLR